MILEACVKKESKSGKAYYMCVVDGQEASTWTSDVEQYKGKALPEGWTLTDGEYGKKLNPPAKQGGFKKEWKPQDPDGMYRCNAMTNAVAFFKGDNLEGLITTYNAIYKAMKGEPAQVIAPAVTNTQTPAKMVGKVPATDSQKNTIIKKAQSYKSDVGNLIKEALKYDLHIEDLSKAEASLVITYFNDKEAKGDEPF